MHRDRSLPGNRYRIAADIGGTFTDIALLTDQGGVVTRKVPSTPGDYSTAVIDGIKALASDIAVPLDQLSEVLHGCTVATNAILERKGARTALVTTKGFRDVLELRRIRMPRLYEPLYVKPDPLAPRRDCLEVAERIDARGAVVTPIETDDVMRAVEHIRRHGIEAVAVVFLHSYANPAHEVAAGEILRRELPDCFVSTSVEILPEIREYERTSTTVINAYVGPPVRNYVRSLSSRLRAEGISAPLLVMQSSGGMLAANAVEDRPAQIVECGPAAGVVGAAHLAEIAGYRNLITLDMGGTTAKASIIEDGKMVKTDEYEVGGGVSLSSRLVKGGGYALKTPVIDISEVGAGGGSIVWLDKAGHIKVGPKSAGAVPGPVCYNAGGTAPTVTDANVVLGYLNPTSIAGGTVPIHAALSRAAIAEQIAGPLGQDVLEVALGIHTLANASMMRAVKAVSTYRGRDPRDFIMFAFGGGGGMHAVGLARELRMKRVVVPPAAGVFSALGLLFSKLGLIQTRAFLRLIDAIDPGEMTALFVDLEQQVLELIGFDASEVDFTRFADLRYAGQAFELTVPMPDGPIDATALTALAEAFEDEHERTYGHRFPGQKAMETVTLRVNGAVRAQGKRTLDPEMTRQRAKSYIPSSAARPACFDPAVGPVDTPVLSRADLSETPLAGPIVIEEYEGTIVVPPGATACLDPWTNIVIDTGVDEERAR